MNKIKVIVLVFLLVICINFKFNKRDDSYDYSGGVNKPVLPDDLQVEKMVLDNINKITYEDGILVTDHSYDKQFLYSEGYTSDEAYNECLKYMSNIGFGNNSTCQYAYNPNDETEIIGFEYKYIGDKNNTTEGGN